MPNESGAVATAVRTPEPAGPASVSIVSLPVWIFGSASALEIAVLCGIQSYWPDTCPTLQRIADSSGVSRRTVANVLDALEAKGWIRRVQRTSEDGTNLSSHYDLLIWPAGEPLPSAGS